MVQPLGLDMTHDLSPDDVNVATEKVFFDRFWARLNAPEKR